MRLRLAKSGGPFHGKRLELWWADLRLLDGLRAPSVSETGTGKCGQLGIRRCGCCSNPLRRGESVTSGSLGPFAVVCLRNPVNSIECPGGF
jgi:hypothetical protein